MVIGKLRITGDNAKVKKMIRIDIHSYEVCIELIVIERRRQKSIHHYEAEQWERFFAGLPMRRRDDPRHGPRLIGNHGKTHRQGVIDKELRGE